MDLIGKPWLPVLDGDGTTRQVGLESLFGESSRLRDLALRPAQRVAVTRLLLAITHAALDGPADADEWASCRERIVPAVLAYLQKYRDRFGLFGDRPFLQVPALEATHNATVDKLDFTLASGNNDTLYDHAGGVDGRELPPASTALNLLTYQCFSPGGRIGVTRWGGQSTGNGSSDHAPAIEGSPLHTVLRGRCLLDLIHLNLVPGDLLPAPLGRPVWECEVDSPTGEAADSLPGTVLGRLVPLSRAILLAPDDDRMTLANGLSYPKVADGGRELAATVVVRERGKQQEHAYLPIDLTRHPWRELQSVLTLGRADGPGGPLALRNLHRQARSGTLDVWVGGLVADRGKLVDEAEWNLSVPMDLLDDVRMGVYRHGVELANLAAGSLRNAVKAYAAELKIEVQGPRHRALSHYWSQLDQEYERLIELADRADRLGPWRELLRRAMRRAYEAACPHTTPRQIEAFVAGQRRLVLPDAEDAGEPTTEEATA